MAMTTRKNTATKALQTAMANAKNFNAKAKLEWEISCNTRGDNTWDADEIREKYDRYGNAEGATKACHLHSHLGHEFEYIVIKRFSATGSIIGGKNQLISEINCWKQLAETEDADLLCPILKYFTSKSDQVSATSKTMRRNVIIIAQKAVKVGNARYACEKAEELNRQNGYRGEDAETRLAKLRKLSDKQGWWDAMGNGGNSGVIFDYSKGCYKAVFIDYAL